MKLAKDKAAKRQRYRQRQAERLGHYLRLAQQAREELLRAGEPDDGSGCRHEWVPEGQTLTGSIDACSICGKLRFG